MKTQRNRLKLEGSGTEILRVMSENNIGCASVLRALAEEHREDAFMYIVALDDMNMRGEQIWVAYKYYCDGDMGLLVAAIKRRDQQMIDKVNSMVRGERAVPRGAAYDHRR